MRSLVLAAALLFAGGSTAFGGNLAGSNILATTPFPCDGGYRTIGWTNTSLVSSSAVANVAGTATRISDGTILSTEIRKSSGYPGLDQAVVAMLGRASPVPPLPEDFPGDQARVVLPFQFELSLINRVF